MQFSDSYLRKKIPHHYLKLPSLFAAWLFWTFPTKSHNMKALVILSHSWSPFLSLTYLYGKKSTFVYLLAAFWCNFLRKTPPRLPMQITWPWPPGGRFCHGLITVRQKKMWTTWLDLCLFTFYSVLRMSPHGIGYKQTWYPHDVR